MKRFALVLVLVVCFPIEILCILYAPMNFLQEVTNFLGKTKVADNTTYDEQNYYDDNRANFDEDFEYDFIIVGAGPAGSVLANRLSQVHHWNILLIEAGQIENYLTNIPAICAMLQLTDFNWGYKMEKQDGVCLGMKDQQCAWPRGKALGGTSVINYMIYTRGNSHDFNRWAAQGNPEWSWENVLPYYMRAERTHLQYADYQIRGTNGYLNIEDIPFRTPLLKSFLNAGRETGHKILDYNGESQFRFSPVQGTVRKGTRCSAYKAYLKPVERRPNLKIINLSRVTQILIDPKKKIAYGVEYLRNGNKYLAYSRKEVILSAGAFSSPQLLMLSGVGPKDHLQELNIPVIQDLPVGQNLHDHLTFVGLTFLINETVSLNLNKVLSVASIFDYTLNGKGPLTSLGGVEALGYIKTANATDQEKDDYPDIEFIFTAGSVNSDGGGAVREGLRLNESFYNEVYKPINFKETWSIIPMLLHPKSIGYLKLRSKNVYDYPLLYGNYYTDPEGVDIATMIAAIKEIIKLSKTKSFQVYGSKLHDIPFPNCKHLQFGSDKYWECCLRTISPSLHHQVGTCKMGPKNDKSAVVDSNLKVYGIKQLRVVDTSIIPFALSAHTNGPSFMIGEKAADLIKEEWLKVKT